MNILTRGDHEERWCRMESPTAVLLQVAAKTANTSFYLVNL